MWTETFINSHINLYFNHIFLIQISTVTLVVVFTHNILGVSKCWVASITYLCFHKYVILMKDFLHPLSCIGCCYFLCPEVRKQFESYSFMTLISSFGNAELLEPVYLFVLEVHSIWIFFTQSSLVACCTVTCAGFSSAIPNLRKLKTVTINSKYTLNMPKMIKYHFH